MSIIPSICVVGAAGQMGQGLLTRLLECALHHSPQHRLHAVDVNYPGLLSTFPLNHQHIQLHESIAEGIELAEVVILAIPYQAEQHLNADVLGAMDGKVVVSITNPLTPALDDVLTPHHESAAESLAAMIPGARVVKALNTISASALLLSRDASHNYDTFVASDHEDAALTVENIIRALGYRPWYVGGLKLSRTLERMTALLIGISHRYALNGPLGWNVQGVTPD